MHRDRRLTVLAGNARDGRCKYCGRRIVWKLSVPGGKWLPFTRHPLILSTFQNELTSVHFEQVSSADLHFATCTNRPKKTAAPRSWAGAR